MKAMMAHLLVNSSGKSKASKGKEKQLAINIDINSEGKENQLGININSVGRE